MWVVIESDLGSWGGMFVVDCGRKQWVVIISGCGYVWFSEGYDGKMEENMGKVVDTRCRRNVVGVDFGL